MELIQFFVSLGLNTHLFLSKFSLNCAWHTFEFIRIEGLLIFWKCLEKSILIDATKILINLHLPQILEKVSALIIIINTKASNCHIFNELISLKNEIKFSSESQDKQRSNTIRAVQFLLIAIIADYSNVNEVMDWRYCLLHWKNPQVDEIIKKINNETYANI